MAENTELENTGLNTDNIENTDVQEGSDNKETNTGVQENADVGQNNNIPDNSEIYGAPETYDYTGVKLPDNYEYDKDMLKEFDKLNKETNLSQAQANKYTEFGLRLAQKQSADLPKLMQQVQQAKVAQFKQAINTDQEIGGGDKSRMDAYLDTADKGYSAFANDEVKAALADAGLNYHPAIIKMFHRIGELVGDDKIHAPKSPIGANDVADVLYGSN